MGDRRELRPAPGTLDGKTWVPPPSSPTRHYDPAMQAPDLDVDLPGVPSVLGGQPSTGWSTEDE